MNIAITFSTNDLEEKCYYDYRLIYDVTLPSNHFQMICSTEIYLLSNCIFLIRLLSRWERQELQVESNLHNYNIEIKALIKHLLKTII